MEPARFQQAQADDAPLKSLCHQQVVPSRSESPKAVDVFGSHELQMEVAVSRERLQAFQTDMATVPGLASYLRTVKSQIDFQI